MQRKATHLVSRTVLGGGTDLFEVITVLECPTPRAWRHASPGKTFRVEYLLHGQAEPIVKQLYRRSIEGSRDTGWSIIARERQLSIEVEVEIKYPPWSRSPSEINLTGLFD